MASGTTTLPLAFLEDTGAGTFAASVISANPTATTFSFGCAQPTSTDKLRPTDCEFRDVVMTIGPWAQPSGQAASGVLEYSYRGVSVKVAGSNGGVLGVKCDIESRTMVKACTQMTTGSPDKPNQTILPGNLIEEGAFTLSIQPITITAGAEKLASAAPATTKSAPSVTPFASAPTTTIINRRSPATTALTSGTGTAGREGAAGVIGLLTLLLAFITR